MAIWSDISRVLSPTQDDLEYAARLLRELEEGQALARTQTSLLRAGDRAMAAFYSALELRRSPGSRGSCEADPSWILHRDICWVNVRACAIDGMPGSFIRAAKLLPSISSDAILLAPFHPVQFDLLYAPESMTIVDESLGDERLDSAGIRAADQLRAFVSACGLLGKRVGYELLPYAAQFSRIAMERPDLFRWVILDERRSGLAYADPDFPYRTEDRLRDSALVAEMVATAKEQYGISSFRKHESDSPETGVAKDKAYYSAIRLCIDRGLWPVPAHARNGVGIPSFCRYDGMGDFPVFTYRDASGLDLGSDAYGVVAPFAFYDDVPANALLSGPVPRNDAAIDYYAHVFSMWRDAFSFDFVRYNAVDRVFEETMDEGGDVPASDRPTPEVVAEAIAASREGAPGIAAIAARKGTDVDRYTALGFDLTMGSEALRRVDEPFVRDALELYDTLCKHAGSGKLVSTCFAVDLPESAAPRLWGSPLARVMGPERMRLRHAMARFLSVGEGRRPMFETMGFQDNSTGLYEAGLSTKGLDWADDTGFAAGYASIERLYARLRPFLDSGRIDARHIEASYAWWQIRGTGTDRLLIAAASLETAEGLSPGRISVPVDAAWGDMEGRAYRLPDSTGIGMDARRSADIDLGFLDFVVVDLAPSFY